MDARAQTHTHTFATPDQDANQGIRCTWITSPDVLTKTYSLDAHGAPVKTAERFPTDGTVDRVVLDPDQPLTELAARFEHMDHHEVLVCGDPVAANTPVRLVTQKALPRTFGGAVARNKDFACYTQGRPGLFMLDHDAKDLPPELRKQVAAAGGAFAVLISIFPGFADASVLIRPSSSTGIRNKVTGKTTPGGGQHIYSVAEDGANIEAFVKRLHLRLVLAGWGWAFISKDGRVFIRSVIDVPASGSSHRLCFEADAVLRHRDLEHVPNARRCVVERDGAFLDTTKLPELDEGERRRVAVIEAQLRADAQPEADQRKQVAIETKATELEKKGFEPAEAKARASRAYETQHLDPTDTAVLDDGQTVTVTGILRNPDAYHGATCADPLEPDYGGGRNKAIVLTKRLPLTIFSQAHGGILYEFGWTARDLIAAWAARRDMDELTHMWTHTLLDNPAADEAALAAAGVPSKAGLAFGRHELRDLVGLVTRCAWDRLNGLQASLRGGFDDYLETAHGLGLVDAQAVRAGIAAAEARRASAKSHRDGHPLGEIPVDWLNTLKRDDKNHVISSRINARIALGRGCGLDRHLRRDRATLQIVVADVPPGSQVWNSLGLGTALPIYNDPLSGLPVFLWSDSMQAAALMDLENEGLTLSNTRYIEDAIRLIADANAYSSVAAYLRWVAWDGVPRLDGWLVRHAGAEDTILHHAVLRLWMIGAVARAILPEEVGKPARMDLVLTLVGPQGARKSTFLHELCAVPQWHMENLIGNLAEKDAILRVAGKWIIDLAEGATLKRSDAEHVKQFITTMYDTVRLPYDRLPQQLLRRCAIAMTLNPDRAGFLRDVTGNRRFLIAEISTIDIGQLRCDRDQLWAEAVARYRNGERYWLDPADPQDAELVSAAADAAEQHRVKTSLEELLLRYIDDSPLLGVNGRLRWQRRPAPLSVIGPLTDVLAELGADMRRDEFSTVNASRALGAMGWIQVKVKFRNAPIRRDQSIWVNRAGAAAHSTRRRGGNDTRRFQSWLKQAAREQAIWLRSGLNEGWFTKNGVKVLGFESQPHAQSPESFQFPA